MTPTELARMVFDRYAALDAPTLPSVVAEPGKRDRLWLSDLQVALARWQANEFGTSTHEHLALGVCEESGELAHAVLKHAQGIRGLGDPDAYREAAGDALADVAIYAIQLATALRLDFGALLLATAERVMERKWRKGEP